ncbi:MAG: sulfite exporter TauE/SafE family protein [Dermatophilaceae bacterium]
MPLVDAGAILLAGMAAGTINTVVGSGTLVTFPTLLVLGYPPLVANMSNNVGLLPGGLAGAYGYRRELAGHGRLVRRLLPWAFAGGLIGALMLLVLPPAVFSAVVPALVLFGLVLVAVGPRLQAWVSGRVARTAEPAQAVPSASAQGDEEPGRIPSRHVTVPAAVFFTGVYGGYFGAAQGVILVGLLSVLLTVGLQSINAVKNALVPCVNLIAAVLFMTLRWSQIDWLVVLLIGIGSAVGGLIGSHIGRRLPPPVLRGTILAVGLFALARLTFYS